MHQEIRRAAFACEPIDRGTRRGEQLVAVDCNTKAREWATIARCGDLVVLLTKRIGRPSARSRPMAATAPGIGLSPS